jgi:hypothetical protein
MAAGATYEPIATQTLASAAASITFSSIAATYTDLRLVLSNVLDDFGSDTVCIRFNSDTATNYSTTRLGGQGTAASSARTTSAAQITLGALVITSTTIPIFFTADIFSYAGSTYKTMLGTSSGDKNGSGAVDNTVGLWRSTSAITSVTALILSGNKFAIGTTATLYGIKAA